MDALERLKSLTTEYARARGLVDRAKEHMDHPQARLHFETLCQEMDRLVARLESAIPAAVGDLQRQIDETHANLAQVNEKMAAVKARFAAMQEAPPPVLPTIQPALLDLTPGEQLRNELLKEFGQGRPARPRPPDEKEIWRLENDEFA